MEIINLLFSLFERRWWNMTLTAATVASLIHFSASLISVFRIGKLSGLYITIFFTLYTFFSAFFYTVLLSFSVIFTYSVSKNYLNDEALFNWGIALGILYVILKAIISGYLK